MRHIVIQGQVPMHVEVRDGLDPADAIKLIAKSLFGSEEHPLQYVDCGSDRITAAALATLPPFVPASAPEAIAAVKDARIAAIKAEAGKRITDRYPTWKQMNLRQQGGDACLEMDAWINQVRAVSNQLESTLPVNFADDSYWPQ